MGMDICSRPWVWRGYGSRATTTHHAPHLQTFDEGGKIVNGNCYWIVATDVINVEKLLLIQGIANTKLMTKYHDLVFTNKLYSGRRRYFTQYVEKYPLPDIDSPISKEVIELVKKLNNSNNKEITKELEYQLEIKVAESFGVEPVFNLD